MSKIITMFIIFCFAITTWAEVALEGAEVGKWTMDADAAYKLAKEKKLPVLMNFTGSDWCYWCKLMDKNVFVKKTWKEYAKSNLILVTIDFPSDKSIVPEKYQERNRELRKKYDVGGYPTYILLDENLKPIGKFAAGREKTPESFRDEVNAAIYLSPEGIKKTLAKLNDKQKKEYNAIVVEYRQVIKELETWLETGPSRNEENLAKYSAFLKKITSIEQKLKKYW